jgi:hypothetical protein
MEWHTAQLSTVCPQCNVTVQPGQVVCMNCGSHLHALPSAGKKGAGKLIAIIGGGVLALGAAVVVVIFVAKAMGRSNAKENRIKNRIKCVNNLSNIGKAHLGFSLDNGGRTPWNLLPSQSHLHFGRETGGNWNESFKGTAGDIFGLSAFKEELGSAKILVSPCDSARTADNEKLQAEWSNINTKDGNPVTMGTSYIFCLGGDFQRPATVVSLTRNLASDNIAAGNWSGADENPVPANAMEGLNKSQGQLVLADGSARQSTDADLGGSGKIVKGHINARGGTSRLGASNTTVIR